MRTIKFRAWDNEMKRIRDDWRTFGTENGLLEIMQFTGLHDKNGKEIYEGDIVRILYTDWMSKSESDPRTLEQYKEDISKIGVVEYKGDKFQLFYPNGGGRTTGSLYEGDHGEKEVIGNIFENKGLLDT